MEIADRSDSDTRRQMTNIVFVRMAIIEAVLAGRK